MVRMGMNPLDSFDMLKRLWNPNDCSNNNLLCDTYEVILSTAREDSVYGSDTVAEIFDYEHKGLKRRMKNTDDIYVKFVKIHCTYISSNLLKWKK